MLVCVLCILESGAAVVRNSPPNYILVDVSTTTTTLNGNCTTEQEQKQTAKKERFMRRRCLGWLLLPHRAVGGNTNTRHWHSSLAHLLRVAMAARVVRRVQQQHSCLGRDGLLHRSHIRSEVGTFELHEDGLGADQSNRRKVPWKPGVEHQHLLGSV